MKRVIHIFGASGSGTTALGREISLAFGLRHMDTDDYFWLPTDPKYTKKRPAEERLFLMEKDLNGEGDVVLSGSLVGWGDRLIPRFTHCIRVNTDMCVRIERIRKREREKFGARIEEGGDMYETHKAFLEWAAKYDTGDETMRSRKRHDLWQQSLVCPVLTIDGASDMRSNIEAVRKFIEENKL